jgi:Tol biopolymer transport system component
MTVDERFERTLPAVLTDLYLGPTPDYRDDLLWQTARTRQRPAWRFPGRWLPMADLVTERVAAPRMPWRLIAVGLVILALLIGGTVAFIGAQQPKLPPPFGIAHNGLIAFEQAGDIVTLDPTTAATHALVTGPEQDSRPVYSNDGTMIAFQRVDANGVRAVYVVDSDGTGLVRVTPDPVDQLLDWTFSPDGRALLVTAIVNGQAQMFEVQTDGSRAPRPLDVRLPTDIGAIEAPSYRPSDGSQVLVSEWLPGALSRSIAVVDLAAGTKRTLVEPSSTSDAFGPVWSPNGEWISYGTYDPNAAYQSSRFHIMAADGSGDHVADPVPGTVYDVLYAWSNDSKRIVLDRGYAADQSHDRTVVLPVEGTGPSVELTCPALGVGNCGDNWIWSPNDDSLLGSVGTAGVPTRYVMADPATGTVTQMPWSATGDGSWQRVGP